jgi:hypothetical protein
MDLYMQQQLNEYFVNHWQDGPDPLEGKLYAEVASKIEDHERVIDIGCGRNLFKSMVKNVIGIDPAFTEHADIITTLEEYKTDERFDVALCMGSINFGNEDYIDSQVEKVVKLLKPTGRVYWKLNPGRPDHISDKCNDLPFYSWTHEHLQALADKHGYHQIDERVVRDDRKVRLYAEWIPAFPAL